MKRARAKLERKIRAHMLPVIKSQDGGELIKQSENLAGYILRLNMVYFWLGVVGVCLGQFIYRVVL